MDINNLITHGVIRPNPFGWVLTPQDVDVVRKVVRHGGGAEIGLDQLERIRKDQPKDFDDFIRVVCKVNGIEYEEVKKKKDPMQEITVDQVKLTIDTVLNEEVSVKILR